MIDGYPVDQGRDGVHRERKVAQESWTKNGAIYTFDLSEDA